MPRPLSVSRLSVTSTRTGCRNWLASVPPTPQNPPIDCQVDDDDGDSQADLHPSRQTCRIENRHQIVLDEAARVAGGPRLLSQSILQRGQRANRTGELDHRTPEGTGKMRPDQPGPAQSQQPAQYHEDDKGEVNEGHQIGGQAVNQATLPCA